MTSLITPPISRGQVAEAPAVSAGAEAERTTFGKPKSLLRGEDPNAVVVFCGLVGRLVGWSVGRIFFVNLCGVPLMSR